MQNDLVKKFSEATDKGLFLEYFFRYEMNSLIGSRGTRGHALAVIFGQSATSFRLLEERDPELFNDIFTELLSRFDLAATYHAPHGTWTVTKKEIGLRKNDNQTN